MDSRTEPAAFGSPIRHSLRRHAWRLLAIAALASPPSLPIDARAGDPWLDGIRRFAPGDFAGFGQEGIPGIVLGVPEGAGPTQGSLDVLSIGHGGSITVVFRDNVVVDGDGDDLVLFENAFHAGNEEGPIFAELAFVEVSADGSEFVAFPHEAETWEGLAGHTPVIANPENAIDPRAPEAGGDRFDLATVGLQMARFVRITDVGDAIDDLGNHVIPGTKGGFDLDAAAAIHSIPPGVVDGVVTRGGEPVARARVKLVSMAGYRTLRRRTAGDGRFRFRSVLPAGDYLVRASDADLGTAEQAVFVGLEQLAVSVDLALD